MFPPKLNSTENIWMAERHYRKIDVVERCCGALSLTLVDSTSMYLFVANNDESLKNTV